MLCPCRARPPFHTAVKGFLPFSPDSLLSTSLHPRPRADTKHLTSSLTTIRPSSVCSIPVRPLKHHFLPTSASILRSIASACFNTRPDTLTLSYTAVQSPFPKVPLAAAVSSSGPTVTSCTCHLCQISALELPLKQRQSFYCKPSTSYSWKPSSVSIFPSQNGLGPHGLP